VIRTADMSKTKLESPGGCWTRCGAQQPIKVIEPSTMLLQALDAPRARIPDPQPAFRPFGKDPASRARWSIGSS